MTATSTPLDRRRPAHPAAGPDVVRAVALIGVVVMNYHGYLILRGGAAATDAVDRFFDPWTGPLSTRFAATFVLVAGVGVTLLTRARRSATASAVRRRCAGRSSAAGSLLYASACCFDEIWDGTILPFYGAMFVLAARAVHVAHPLAGRDRRGRRARRRGDRTGGGSSGARRHTTRAGSTRPDRRSPRGLVLDVFVNGTHPAAAVAGVLLRRASSSAGCSRRAWWRPAAIGWRCRAVRAGRSVDRVAATGDRGTRCCSTDPFEPRPRLHGERARHGADRVRRHRLARRAVHRASPLVDCSRDAGQMTLTLYVAHALVFNLVVDWLGWIRPTGLDTALVFAAASGWSASPLAVAGGSAASASARSSGVYRRLGG